MIEQWTFGPLADHRKYIAHIAIPNYMDFLAVKNEPTEKPKTNLQKYKELRHFLNAAESFNNILDYFFFEHQESISHKRVNIFRNAAHTKFPELGKVADIANAYKHCVRVTNSNKNEGRGEKNESLPWAKDLQKADIILHLKSEAIELAFQAPITEQEEALEKVYLFWIKYHDSPFQQDLINA